MKRENFYRRDPGLALAGMQGMSLEERGVYNTVLDLLYLTWRPIEDVPAYIAAHCGCAVQKLNPILRRLIASGKLVRFTEDGQSYISNPKFEDERRDVKGASGSRSGRGQVGSKSGEVAEKSTSVGENSALLDANTTQKHTVTPLEKSRRDQTRQFPPNPPEGGSEFDGFEHGWRSYPEAGKATRGRSAALAAWVGAVERAGSVQRLLGAIKAFADGAYVTAGRPVPAFHNWLRNGGFEASLDEGGSAPSWPGPADILDLVATAMKDRALAAGYLARCTWQDVPAAIIAPHKFAADQLQLAARQELADRGVSIIVGQGRAA